jgi:hypothetical protein
MRKVIGTIGTTLAIVFMATSAAPAGAQNTAADPPSPPGPDSNSRLVRGTDLVAVVSDAPEGLRATSSLAQVDGGWELAVDVVELRRVPDTASVLATYRVTTDDAGDVASYERVRRFTRGEAD